MYKTGCRCARCIYRDACPCGYHVGNAACITIYQPQTKEMLLQCLSAEADPIQAWETLDDYLKGYDEFLTDIPLAASVFASLTLEQLHVLSDRKNIYDSKADHSADAENLQTVITFLDLTKTQTLTIAEYAVLLALMPQTA